jgi:hypothetical protein
MGSEIACRERATECMRIAESRADPCAKTVWMRCAAEWVGLATQIELDDRDERSSKHERAKIEKQLTS